MRRMKLRSQNVKANDVLVLVWALSTKAGKSPESLFILLTQWNAGPPGAPFFCRSSTCDKVVGAFVLCWSWPSFVLVGYDWLGTASRLATTLQLLINRPWDSVFGWDRSWCLWRMMYAKRKASWWHFLVHSLYCATMDMLYGLQMISPVVCKCPFLAHSACKDAEFRRHYEHVAANSGSPWASIKGKVAMLHTVVDATISGRVVIR